MWEGGYSVKGVTTLCCIESTTLYRGFYRTVLLPTVTSSDDVEGLWSLLRLCYGKKSWDGVHPWCQVTAGYTCGVKRTFRKRVYKYDTQRRELPPIQAYAQPGAVRSRGIISQPVNSDWKFALPYSTSPESHQPQQREKHNTRPASSASLTLVSRLFFFHLPSRAAVVGKK